MAGLHIEVDSERLVADQLSHLTAERKLCEKVAIIHKGRLIRVSGQNAANTYQKFCHTNFFLLSACIALEVIETTTYGSDRLISLRQPSYILCMSFSLNPRCLIRANNPSHTEGLGAGAMQSVVYTASRTACRSPVLSALARVSCFFNARAFGLSAFPRPPPCLLKQLLSPLEHSIVVLRSLAGDRHH